MTHDTYKKYGLDQENIPTIEPSVVGYQTHRFGIVHSRTRSEPAQPPPSSAALDKPMEPYSQTPLNLALRSERKAEEFIKTWRFNHAAHYYRKAADNISKAISQERDNNLVPKAILDSLEEQNRFYLYQEQVCQTRRSHVGHLFKDKGRLSSSLSKQAEQFAQAHSLLLRSQNSLQQHRHQQPQQQKQQSRSHPATDLSALIDETNKLHATSVAKECTEKDSTKINYNITSNPLCDYCLDDNQATLASTSSSTSTALLIRPSDSSLQLMALPNRSSLAAGINRPDRANKGQHHPIMEEENAEDYDLGDKFNGGSTAYRNLLFEINRLFSEHNTLLDYLTGAIGICPQPIVGSNSEPQASQVGHSDQNIDKRERELSDQQVSDTFGKLRWNQNKLRNIISDLVQQLEKTNQDNERLRCQIMTLTRPDSRLDQIFPLPPLEPPTLQY